MDVAQGIGSTVGLLVTFLILRALLRATRRWFDRLEEARIRRAQARSERILGQMDPGKVATVSSPAPPPISSTPAEPAETVLMEPAALDEDQLAAGAKTLRARQSVRTTQEPRRRPISPRDHLLHRQDLHGRPGTAS